MDNGKCPYDETACDCVEGATLAQIRDELKRRLEIAQREAQELWEKEKDMQGKRKEKERLVQTLGRMVDA